MSATSSASDINAVSILLFPFSLIFLVIKGFFYGLKYITIDKISSLVSSTRIKSEEVYKGIKYHGTEEEVVARREEKKAIKQSKYKYSVKYLQKLEDERNQLNQELRTTGAVRSENAVMYKVTVRGKDGRIGTEILPGLSKSDINAFLVNEGFEVYSIKTSRYVNMVYGKSNFTNTQMKVKDLLFWLTQLSTYLKAGITLTNSVRILGEQLGKKNRSRKRAFQSIVYHLTLGEDFSVALEKQGKMFPGLLINMIKAAEASGTLEETLDDMADYYTEIDKTRKQMISAITYPAIISVFAVGVIIFILVYVIPKFTEIYAASDLEIKGITKTILNISNFLKNNYLIIIIVIISIILGFRYAYKRIRVFRTKVQIFLMKLPVVKDLIIYNELTIFTKTFASLLKNNVFITDSIDILTKITNNEIYKDIMYKTIDNISKGENISESFKNHWAIPEVAYHMIVTGESTGELASMMQKVSEYYQEQHRNLVTNLKNFIEPVLICTLALIVGVIIISVLSPMFTLYDSIE